MQESLVKYLAGLMDADGSLCFQAAGGCDENLRISLKLSVTAADSIDQHGFVGSLAGLTGMGSIERKYDKYTSWNVRSRRDIEMLLPRLIKHMVIKAQHWQWMLEVWREYRSRGYGSKNMTADEWIALSQASRESRKLRVGPLKPKNHPTWAWLAGYLDGDGCFSFRTSRNHNMRLSVTAHITDVSCLEFLQRSFGGTIRKNSRTDNVRVWWRGLGPANRSFALRFLSRLVKHARFKRHKIEQMISYHRQRLSDSASAEEATV